VASGSHSVAIYFNGGCLICVQYVETLEHALSSAHVDAVKYDYYASSTVGTSLFSLREKLGVPPELYGSVTVVVDGRYIFEGYFPVEIVIDFLNQNPNLDKLIAAQGLRPNTYRLQSNGTILECNTSQKIEDCLSSSTVASVLGMWALVLVSGFVNGMNPCVLAVLAYFIGVVSINRTRKEILKIGLLYVFSIYLVYLGIGVGLMRALLSSGYVDVVSKAFGTLLIAVAIVGLLNILRRRSAFPKIPRRLISPIAKRFSHSWIQRSATAAALLFGGVVAALEFPCTGGVYAAIIGVLSLQRMNLTMTLFLLGYNLMFVLPLVILLILSYSIADSSLLRQMTERHKYLSRLISALLLLWLGVFLLFHSR